MLATKAKNTGNSARINYPAYCCLHKIELVNTREGVCLMLWKETSFSEYHDHPRRGDNYEIRS